MEVENVDMSLMGTHCGAVFMQNLTHSRDLQMSRLADELTYPIVINTLLLSEEQKYHSLLETVEIYRFLISFFLKFTCLNVQMKYLW